MEDQRNGIACMKEIDQDSSLWRRHEGKVFGKIINGVHKTVENVDLLLLKINRIYPSPLKLWVEKFHWWILKLTFPNKHLNCWLLECRRACCRNNQLLFFLFCLGNDDFLSFSSWSWLEGSYWTRWTFNLAYCHVGLM